MFKNKYILIALKSDNFSQFLPQNTFGALGVNAMLHPIHARE